METLLITGGSRGIGAAVARKAIGKYNVAIFYNNSEESAKALYNELCEKGNVAIFKCDVSNHESVKEAVNNVKKVFGNVDKLCCSAGISQSKLFIDLTDEDWRKTFGVNVDGIYFVTKEVVPQMLHEGKGSIVYISSIWGEEGACMESAYASSKAAVLTFARFQIQGLRQLEIALAQSTHLVACRVSDGDDGFISRIYANIPSFGENNSFLVVWRS